MTECHKILSPIIFIVTIKTKTLFNTIQKNSKNHKKSISIKVTRNIQNPVFNDVYYNRYFLILVVITLLLNNVIILKSSTFILYT